MLYFVYELVDPRTDIPHYVGITDNPNQRFQEHVGDTKTNGKKRSWIEQLQKEDFEPRMRILEIVETREKALEREKYLIQHYVALDLPITNIAGVPNVAVPEGYLTAKQVREQFNISYNDLCVYATRSLVRYLLIAEKKRRYFLKCDVEKIAEQIELFNTGKPYNRAYRGY